MTNGSDEIDRRHRRNREKRFQGILVPVMLSSLLSACAPQAFEFIQLEPVKTPGVMTLQDFVSVDTSLLKRAPPNARQILLLGQDSVSMALSLYEFSDILWLDMYVQNRASEPYVINPDHVILTDADRIAFKRLAPHEAANICKSKVSSAAVYSRKSAYDVVTATAGYLDWSGPSRLQAYRVPRALQDPYGALDFNFGATMIQRSSRRLLELAGVIYSTGFVAGALIPPTTSGFGGIFWLKREDIHGPLRLRIAYATNEVEFRNPKQ
jgi:hypothetical protein